MLGFHLCELSFRVLSKCEDKLLVEHSLLHQIQLGTFDKERWSGMGFELLPGPTSLHHYPQVSHLSLPTFSFLFLLENPLLYKL